VNDAPSASIARQLEPAAESGTMNATKSPSHLAPGERLRNCTIRELIGRGRDTEIYRAYHPDFKRDVAIKVFRIAAPRSAEMTAKFLKETSSSITLRHPNIIRVYASGVSQDSYYLVMELVEGTSLRDVLSTHLTGLDREDALRIFSQIASGVATAHDQGMVHGNIKPDKVLLDAQQRPVLTDFTLPDLHEPPDDASSPAAYLSPEQAIRHIATPESDIYALGILLYEMVSGDVPFKGPTRESVIQQHQSSAPVAPSQIIVGLDPRVDTVILKALSKNPSERFTSAREMVRALEDEEAIAQYETLNLERKGAPANHKRRSDIARFEKSRVAEPAEGSRPSSRLRFLAAALLAAGAVVLVVIAVALAVILR
jgi:serine/threonine protein kinase